MSKLEVFLDSNVLIAYLEKKEGLDRLFSDAVLQKVQYAINPVVLTELLLIGSRSEKNIDDITKYVELMQIDENKTKEFLNEAASLRNRVVHTNDLLILSTAASCDYLVTYDKHLANLAATESVNVVAPEEFLSLLETYK